MQHTSNIPTPQTGKLLWQDGLLLFTMRQEYEVNAVVSPGNLEGFLKFASHLADIQLPQTTNILVVRRLHHHFTLHNLLNYNGIDMFPINQGYTSKGNSKFAAKFLELITMVSKYARSLVTGGWAFLILIREA